MRDQLISGCIKEPRKSPKNQFHSVQQQQLSNNQSKNLANRRSSRSHLPELLSSETPEALQLHNYKTLVTCPALFKHVDRVLHRHQKPASDYQSEWTKWTSEILTSRIPKKATWTSHHQTEKNRARSNVSPWRTKIRQRQATPKPWQATAEHKATMNRRMPSAKTASSTSDIFVNSPERQPSPKHTNRQHHKQTRPIRTTPHRTHERHPSGIYRSYGRYPSSWKTTSQKQETRNETRSGSSKKQEHREKTPENTTTE